MTKRIEALRPGLPPPVTAKLLAQDAGELDFRLGHPEALDEQARGEAGGGSRIWLGRGPVEGLCTAQDAEPPADGAT
jgi:hypothetical protein